MIVRKLKLNNFRNYLDAEIEFDEKLNIIYGKNGSGKTNLVEAIYYLNLTRPLRDVSNLDLIRNHLGKARIDAECDRGGTTTSITCEISSEGKKVLINGKRVDQISTLAKLVNIIAFEPKDVFLFKGSPSLRRNFLDVTLIKQYPEYLNLLIGHEKVLKERNHLLKGESVDQLTLEVLTSQLADLSIKIIDYRQKICSLINEILSKVITHIAGTNYRLEIVYEPFIGKKELSKDVILEAYNKSLEKDIKNKMTMIGIQREDFLTLLNGQDISLFGSQGENRLGAIALKIVPYFLIINQEDRPLIILDDVMSELDESHQNHLYTFLKKLGQVFVTTTLLQESNATTFEIKNNQIKRR